MAQGSGGGEVRQRKGKKDGKDKASAAKKKQQTSSGTTALAVAATNNKKRSKKKKADDPPGQQQTAAGAAGTAAATAAATTAAGDETLWQTFTGHPLVVVAPYILLPYLIYTGYYYLVLKRPDVLANLTLGLMSVRPAVHLHDSRQLLVVGAVGSGTERLAAALAAPPSRRGLMPKLEVCHEATNAEEFFARDGTVSNFLGIRYAEKALAGDPSAAERMAKLVTDVCIERGGSSTDVLQPKSYQPSSCPSYYKSWSNCHARECLDLVSSEWGCGLVEGGDGCRSHFVRVLHLVLHPMRTIQELTYKVCPGDTKTVHPAFRQLATVFYDEGGGDNGKKEDSSCLEHLARYVVNFNRAMLAARRKGLIHATIQYERISLCDVVELGGFLDPQLSVYPPNVRRLSKICGDESDESFDAEAQKPLPLLGGGSSDDDKVPAVSWDDIREAGGSSLEKSLRSLCKDLGYDPDVIDIVSREEGAKAEESGGEDEFGTPNERTKAATK